MGNESERTSPLLLDFDARLGLEMQLQHPTTVYSCDGIPNHCEGSITMSSHSSDAFNTASQRQDCDRQKKVTHKYMTPSVPFPPELPFLSSNRPPPLVHNASQPNWSGWDMSFSSSSSSSPGVTDPEPWRCKRTDGKKWRCSRDVAPDHKYCERHAHKSRTRSRKHVELAAGSCNNNATVARQRSTSQYPTTMAASSADQARCLQWKQPTHASSSPSPGFRSYTDSMGTNSSSVYLPLYDDKQDLLTSLNSYIPLMDNHFQTNNGYQSCDSIQGAKTSSLYYSLCPNYTTQTFIDAWDNEGKRYEQPSSTLSLSVSGGIKIIDEDQNGDLNSGNSRTRHEWMNVGGPLGEALCLGNANTTRVCSYLASSQGYSNSSNTTDTTNSSKSNCDEDGRSHGL